jgi:hypothetical protein
MLKTTRMALLLAALGACLAGAHAQTTRVAEGEDRFVAGGTVRQDEPVPRNLVGVGGDVDLATSVGRDAVLAGGNVRVREGVQRDLFAAGGNVRVEGAIARNARLAGGNVEIASSASVAGRLTAAGGTVHVRGPVGGSIDVAAGDLLVDSEVGGDVRAAAGNVELGPNARIGGRLLLAAAWVDVRRHPEARVQGGVRVDDSPRHRSHGSGGGWLWSSGLIVLAALAAGLFPAAIARLGAGLRAKPGLAVASGFAVLACVPAAALVIAITIIGLPIALLLLFAYILTLAAGYVAAGVLLGDAALARLRGADATQVAWRVGAAALAALALALLARVPVVGWLVGLAAIVIGIGAIAVAVIERRAAAAAV